MVLAAVGYSVLAMMNKLTFLPDQISTISSQAISVVTFSGGLLIATTGAQFASSRLKIWFEM